MYLWSVRKQVPVDPRRRTYRTGEPPQSEVGEGSRGSRLRIMPICRLFSEWNVLMRLYVDNALFSMDGRKQSQVEGRGGGR